MDQQTRQTFVTLIQTQAWTRHDIVAYQVGLLERLCRHARATLPFWVDRLAPLFPDGETFDPGGWTAVPVLTREEAWRHRDDLSTHAVPPVMLPLEAGSTTGSTGTPLPFLRTAVSRTMAEAQLARALAWRKLGVLNPIVISKAVTGDVAGREAGTPLSAGEGPIHYVDFMASPAIQVMQVCAAAPRLILTYPNVALSWLEAGYDFAGVHAVVMTGEAFTDTARARLTTVFSGEILNLYSASEAGPIAIETPSGALAVCEENVFLEEPLPGSDRRQPHPVIMTPFYSYGAPLIRYAPGDFAVFGAEPEAATPGLRRIDGLAGRARNMFRRRDGSAFWPNLSGAKLMAIAGHTHRQLIQEGFGRFVMRVVFDVPPSPEQLLAMAAHVSDVVGGAAVEVVPVTSIDDGRASGKAYENFICRMT